MSVNVLFVTFNDFAGSNYGGAQCSRRNYLALKEHALVDTYLVKKRSALQSALSFLFFFYPPFLINDLNNLEKILKNKKYDYVFLDSSLMGRFVKKIKKKYRVQTITFFHNVEVDYNKVRFGNSILGYPYLVMAWINEYLSAKYADVIIGLNTRDKLRIFDIYHRKCDYIIPITFQDQVGNKQNQLLDIHEINDEKTCLFIGAFGRANYEGIKWFVENVAKHLDAKLIVAGKGFEQKKAELERENVEVLGEVSDLAELYLKADCVVLPLLSGAGMKVKTAEALMYGKTIFGTKEAFEGYELDFKQVGGLCNDAAEFIAKINRYLINPSKFNKYSRDFYLERHSHEIAINEFGKLFLRKET